MARKAKWIGILLLFPCMLMFGAGNALGAFERLTAEDFPCNTLIPKCPDTYSIFLSEIMKIFSALPPIDIDVDEDIDVVNTPLCHIYMSTDTVATIDLSSVLNAEFNVIREEGNQYEDHLRLWIEVGGIDLANLNLQISGGCGPLPFNLWLLPINLNLSFEDITINAITLESVSSILLEDESNLELRYEFPEGTPSGYSAVNMEMTLDLDLNFIAEFLGVDDFMNAIINSVSNNMIAPEVNKMLLSDVKSDTEGILLDGVEQMMDMFYQIPTISSSACGGCGGTMPSMPSLPSLPFASRKQQTVHVAANMMTYLLPIGFAFYYKRKRKK